MRSRRLLLLLSLALVATGVLLVVTGDRPHESNHAGASLHTEYCVAACGTNQSTNVPYYQSPNFLVDVGVVFVVIGGSGITLVLGGPAKGHWKFLAVSGVLTAIGVYVFIYL